MPTVDNPNGRSGPSNVRRTVWNRNRWILPVVLVLLVVGVVLGFTIGPKLKSSASAAPTATPGVRTVVVTATLSTQAAGGPTATANVVNPATATPGGAKGVSTPLPGNP